MIRRREIGCDNEGMDTDSLQEEDGALRKTMSLGVPDDITNKRITKLFISSEAFPKNSCSSNKEMIKEISVLKQQYMQLRPLRS